MPAQLSQIADCIEKLIDEKIRLEAINSKRDELLKRNIGKDLIHSSMEDSRRKIALAKSDLAGLLQQMQEN